MEQKLKRRLKRTIANVMSWACLIILSFFMMLLVYFLFIDGNPPIVINNEPLPISAETARPGETIIMVYDFCKNSKTQSELYSFWQRKEDGLIWEQSRRELSVSNIGCHVFKIPLVIPEDIPPGEWKRYNSATFRVNLLATHTVDWESEYITIQKE